MAWATNSVVFRDEPIDNAVSASFATFALTASYTPNQASSSYALSSSFALTASFLLGSIASSSYAAFQAFSIPTEADNDADAHTHSVASKTVLIDPLIASIDAATTEDELKLAYFEAIKIAGHDAAAKNAIIVAKDLKKASL